MKFRTTGFLLMAMALGTLGCAQDADTTTPPATGEPSAPRIELGEEDVDLDPSTDDDVDIDTPAPGDT